MNIGFGNIIIAFPEFPGNVLDANNGLSVTPTGFAVLGNDVGDLAAPAALLSTREIEAGNFAIQLLNTPLGLQTQYLAGGTIYTDNANGLQGIIQSTSLQLNSNVFGGVATLQAADPIGFPQSFLTLIGPNNDSQIQLGGSFRFLENLDGCIYGDNVGGVNFQFDVTNTEFRIFEGAPATKAGAVIAGKAVNQQNGGVPPVVLTFPGDEGRVIVANVGVSNQINISVPVGIPGAFFDLVLPSDQAAGVPVLTINLLSANDVPGNIAGAVGTAAGGWLNAVPGGGEYVRFQCTKLGNGVDVNWQCVFDPAGAFQPF